MFSMSPAPSFLKRGNWIVYDGRAGSVVAQDLTEPQARALIADLSSAPTLNQVERRATLSCEQIRGAADRVLGEIGERATPSQVCRRLPGLGKREAALLLTALRKGRVR